MVSFKDLGSEQQALTTNQIEAAVGDLPVWNEYDKGNPGKVTWRPASTPASSTASRWKKNGNPELLKTVNEVLAAAKSDGTYDKIYAEWIGPKPTVK